MAKSLRSKKVQKNKAIKRETSFGDVAASRERRIAERLHNAAYENIVEQMRKPAAADSPAAAQDADAMDVETPPAPEQKPRLTGLGTNLNKKRREMRKAKSKRGSKRSRK